MKRRIVALVIVVTAIIIILLYKNIDFISYFIGVVYGIISSLYCYYSTAKVGTLYIEEIGDCEEKWRITLNDGYIAKNVRKVILDIERINRN